MLKRSATSDLNHTNWDDEDEPDKPSDFKLASDEVMSKRVIKTGQRRLGKANQEKPMTSAPFAKFSFGSMASSETKGTTSSYLAPSQPKEPLFNGSVNISGPAVDQKKAAGSDKETVFLAKLKGLNEELLSWVDSRLKNNPTCLLTPVFADYDKYLKQIQSERDAPASTAIPSFGSFKFSALPTGNGTSSSATTSFLPSPAADSKSSKPFGSSLFMNSSESPFALGSVKPFTFGSAATSPTQNKTPEVATEDADSEEPPKNNFQPVTEDDAVFSQKVKVFVKKESEDFAERGVGTLYIKPANGKYQAIVRADTSLGNLLLNIILTEGIPCKRMGKNNVLLVCIPIPGADPKPLPLLLRVKTSEEADELLKQLSSHKK